MTGAKSQVPSALTPLTPVVLTVAREAFSNVAAGESDAGMAKGSRSLVPGAGPRIDWVGKSRDSFARQIDDFDFLQSILRSHDC